MLISYLLLDVLDQPARRRHYNLAPLQLLALLPLAASTIHTRGAQIVQLAIATRLRMNLLTKLARGCADHANRAVALRIRVKSGN